MGEMTGKTALITGAAGGIGAATARLFAANGAALVLIDLDSGALGAVRDSVLAATPGATVECITADIADLAAMTAAVAQGVARFGRLDTAILNAGIEGPIVSIENMSIDDYERVMRVNVTGVLVGIKCCTPALRASGGGSIAITASVASVLGTPYLSAYTTSKHALTGLMRCAAIEGAPDKIRVNCVNPSPVETRMMRALESGFAPDAPEAAKQAQIGMIPLDRYAEPGEVAETFLFLASDRASFLTGQSYFVDGGMTCGLARL